MYVCTCAYLSIQMWPKYIHISFLICFAYLSIYILHIFFDFFWSSIHLYIAYASVYAKMYVLTAHTLSLWSLSYLLSFACTLSISDDHVCHFVLSTSAHTPGTPSPGRIGGFLCKPIFFHLNQSGFWRSCAPPLVLTRFFRVVCLSFSTWEWLWKFECFYVYTIWHRLKFDCIPA